ncbi:MAG TPA: biotin--[acetyl-CoA-carboxylase] ligase [Blastocatellia bacterium]|nr:biotin--[acetyl-CoA-carboxylase] ligase [Blastocatellia bacterium]
MTRLGSTVLRFESLPSTNDLAREMAQSGEGEGLVILARQQTAGRGRQGRSWSSPPGEGLYVSLVLRPDITPLNSPVITLAAAVAVAETLEQDYRISSDIKWPNDVLARGRKICGILVESAIEANKLLYAIMGIGVNLGQREFPAELKETATSLLIESEQLVTPDEFLKPLLERLEYWYRQATAQPPEVIARWEAMSSYARNCVVRVESSDSIIEGTTRGLTAKGALVIEMAGGERREIVSGEVKLRKG